MKTAEQLLADGVEIPDDPVEIAKLLEGAAETPASEEEPKPADAPVETGAEDADAAAKAAEETAAAETAAKAATEAAAAAADQDEAKGPPAALLRSYRERLHESDRQLEATAAEKAAAEARARDLEAQLEAIKTKVTAGQETLQAQADKLGADVQLKGLTPEKIEELRRTLDDDVVEVITSLAKSYETQQEQLQRVLKVNEELEQDRERLQRQRLYDEIDSVPLLGVLRISKDPEAEKRWERAVAYQKALKADPDWAARTPREIFNEVARRMEGFLGADVVKTLIGDRPAGTQKGTSPQDVIDKALAAAHKAAVPSSLSEIPAAGTAAAQDGLGRAEAMSTSDLASLMDSYIAKGGNSDDLIVKLLTASG